MAICRGPIAEKKKKAFPVAVVSHLLLAASDIRKLWVTVVSQSGSIITRGLHGHKRAPRDAIIKDEACRSELSACTSRQIGLEMNLTNYPDDCCSSCEFWRVFFFFFALGASGGDLGIISVSEGRRAVDSLLHHQRSHGLTPLFIYILFAWGNAGPSRVAV